MDIIPIPRYQSNVVRAMLLAAGIVALLITPLELHIISVPVEIPSWVFVLVCVALAGIINRKIPYSFIITGAVAMLFLIVFQLSANDHMEQKHTLLTVVDEAISLLLFFTAYYSFRSYRELKQLVRNNNQNT